MYVNFCLRILTKSPAIPQRLYKPASRGLSAIAELLVRNSSKMKKKLRFYGPQYTRSYATYTVFKMKNIYSRHDLRCQFNLLLI